MPIEDKTLVYGLPKPHPTNRASEDVLRIRAALDQVDKTFSDQDKKVNQAIALTSQELTPSGIFIGRNIASWNSNTSTLGLHKIQTKILRASRTMFRFDIQGYDYATGTIIDHSICGYVYDAGKGIDGAPGVLIRQSAVRRGNSAAKNRIFLGFDATGFLAICFGTPKASCYYTQFVVSVMLSLGKTTSSKDEYTLSIDTSDAPAVGATTGFELTCLTEI